MTVYTPQDDVTAQGNKLAAVTPSNTADLPGGIARALFIGTPGTISLVLMNDTAASTLTISAVPFILPFAVKRVMLTGTTVGNIFAVY